MKKVGLVYSFEKSSWKSCQTILKNLLDCYQQSGVQLSHYNYNSKQTIFDLDRVVADVSSDRPDEIIFIDHKPHPLLLIGKILESYYENDCTFPRFTFHIYGDFSLYYPQWALLLEILEGVELRFICASHAQKRLVSKFIQNKEIIEVIPFSVNSSDFFFDHELAQAKRVKWQCQDNEVVIVYSGRLSFQKNIEALIEDFAKASERRADLRLKLCGHFDAIGEPFFYKNQFDGEYETRIFSLLESLPQQTQDKIEFLGQLSSKELLEVYNGADYLVNLSTHNDEDFGMSCAEALCCGLPMIITSWGGFNDFKFNESSIQHITTAFSAKEKVIDRNEFLKVLSKISRADEKLKSEIANWAKTKYSTQNVSHLIVSSLENFKHQSTQASELLLSVVEKLKKDEPLYLYRTLVTDLYKEIYGGYLEN